MAAGVRDGTHRLKASIVDRRPRRYTLSRYFVFRPNVRANRDENISTATLNHLAIPVATIIEYVYCCLLMPYNTHQAVPGARIRASRSVRGRVAKAIAVSLVP